MTETALTRRILGALNALPRCKAIKLHGSRYQQAGTPDIHATARGQSFWLEVKLPGYEPTRLQSLRLREWAEAGAVARVVRSVEEAVDAILNRKDPNP